MPTLPASTRNRGVARRGVAMRGSSPSKYGQPGAKPLVPRRAVVARQTVGFLVDPRNVANRKAVDVQFFVSECHRFSIAIKISLLMKAAIIRIAVTGLTPTPNSVS